jgi:hypothetical protein
MKSAIERRKVAKTPYFWAYLTFPLIDDPRKSQKYDSPIDKSNEPPEKMQKVGSLDSKSHKY